MENYGAHDWDGTGQCPQYWKMKGGQDFFYQLGNETPSDEHISELVQALRGQIEWDDLGSRQYIIGYSIVEDAYLTEFERSQLEYEGEIRHPARVLKLAEIEDFAYFGA